MEKTKSRPNWLFDEKKIYENNVKILSPDELEKAYCA